MFTYY